MAQWRTGYTIGFDDLTPAKTVEGKADLDLASLGAKALAVTIAVQFGASADGDATLKFYGSSDGGTTIDGTAISTLSVTYTVSAGNTVTKTTLVQGYPWLRVAVLNGNTAVEDITISGVYALLIAD